MPAYTFADLRTPESIASIRARLIAALNAAGAPTDSWAPSSTGGTENLRADMWAGVCAAIVSKRIAQAVNMRVLPLAVAAATAEGTGGGPATLAMRKFVRDFYKLQWRDPTFTIENVRLSTIGNPGSYTFNPGDLWARADGTGNRYNNIAGGVLQPGLTLDLPFQAENPGSSYSDSAGTILTMVTARAGVQCTNVRPADFTAVRTSGGSSGTYVATFTDPAVVPGFGSIRIRITASGDIGTAVGQASTDGGNSWSTGFVIPSETTLDDVRFPGTVDLKFSNGTSPSFIIGDILTCFLGDAILQRGADLETPQAVGNRCGNRWPGISLVPTRGKIELWAHQASQEVERVSSMADPNTPGGTLVTIASSSGPASPQAQIAVEDYISARLLGFKGVQAAPGFTSPEETVLVSTATRRNILGQGQVYVPRAIVAPAQLASNVAWLAYLRSIPLGGKRGAIVRAAVLEDILTANGADHWENVTVGDGVGSFEDLILNPGEVAVSAPGATLASTMNWVPM